MDFTLTAAQEAFREEVRSWLKTNIPRDWQARAMGSADVPRPEAYDAMRAWQRKLYDAGYIGLTWPKEYGGRGLTFLEEMILHEEMALAKAPPILNILGIGMAGPTIIAYGTEAQKQRYPARILSCEEIWCQGYSEPNAGSDLASLQTRAVKDGEHWVVNGQKVWTSFAHIADYMMLLARTDPAAPKHKGISVLLIPTDTEGLVRRPFASIVAPDDLDFNEVFFNDVRVPRANLIGALNGGWKVAHGSLGHERSMLWMSFAEWLDDLIRDAPSDADWYAKLLMDAQALRLLGYRQLSGERDPAELSMLKVLGSEAVQSAALNALEECGAESLIHPATTAPYNHMNLEDLTASWFERYARSFGGTIAGGTSEIQRNIIAERILGLPR